MKRIVVAAVLATTFAMQTTAFAGASFSAPVYIGTNIAYGSLRSARVSGNTREYIGCGVYGATNQPATTYVMCSAVNAAGASWSCSTYAPSAQLVQAALAVSAGSYLIAQSDGAYNCTYIHVNNNSAYQ
jgi:hypothetical protein